MIKLIYGYQRENHAQLINEMHRLRKSVFHERLKWDVPITGDWEIDHFDDENPLYILSLDDQGALRGSLRLLPTAGPNMLRDVFSKITEQSGVIENPFVWESSRFCVRLGGDLDQRDTTTISKTTVELIAAMGEVGLLAGLDHVVTVYDAFLRRIIRQAGCKETLVGAPVRYGNVMTYAGLFEIDRISLKAFKAAWNLPLNLIDENDFQELSVAA
jgi:acyl homoserine lactone synthase